MHTCHTSSDLLRKYLVSCLLTWFMVLWGLFFLLWTHQQRLRGIFPSSQKRRPSNLCSPFPRKQALFGEHGSRAGGDWGGEPEMLELGRGLKPAESGLRGWRGERTAPRRPWDPGRGVGAGLLSRPETPSCSVWEQLPHCSQTRRQCSCRTYQLAAQRPEQAASCVGTD